ncbi:MAG: hypothetical protein ABI577_16100, partial [bacterium]
EMNVGGQQVACTIAIVNYIDVDGGLASSPNSTITMTRCVGASGPVSTLTCTTEVTVLTAPVTSVSQCNASGNGGGGTVRCSVSIINHFAGQNPALTPVTVYQCVGSVITGTGAPGVCTPANTPNINSIGEATVGQCNGSGNGGTSVGFTCTVSGSSLPLAMAINIDQCNGSAEGGGALTECFASFENIFAPVPTPTAVPPTPTATASPTEVPVSTPTATPTVEIPSPTPTVIVPTSTPTVIVPTSTPTVVVPTSTPTQEAPPTTPIVPTEGTPPVQNTPTVGVPNTTPQAQVPPTRTPATTPQAQVPPSSTPLAPSTGSALTTADGGTPGGLILVIGLAITVLGLGALRISTRSR